MTNFTSTNRPITLTSRNTGTTFESARVSGRGPAGTGGTGSGVLVASVVLYCPTLAYNDLTPTDGDTMYWVSRTPGLTDPDPTTGLSDWTTEDTFTWSEGWATSNDPTSVLILTDDDSWLPAILAEVTPTGFTAVEVLGGQPVILGCGGADGSLGTVWTGWNTGDGQGGAIDPTLPAIYIQPTGMLADEVLIIDRSGGGNHVSLADWVLDNAGGAVASVDGRTGTVTLDDLYDPAGAAQAVADGLGTAAALDAGSADGVAELDSGGKVPSSQLPSYVDDVVEVANFAALPGTGETGLIYVTLDTNLTYRWSGSAYVEISASLALGETSGTAYRGDRGKTAYDHSQVVSGNPHGTTAADVGADPAGTAAGLVDDLSGVSNQATARTNLGLGTAATAATGDFAAASHTHTGTQVTVDASGFNGNLTTSDDTVQEIAQKLDDLTIPAAGIADPGGANDDFLQRKSGAWTYRTVAEVKNDLGVSSPFYVATPVGEYVGSPSPDASAQSASNMVLGAAGRSNAHPLYLTAGTYDRIGVIVESTGTATLRIGLYASSATTGLPAGTPVLDAGTVSAGSSGLQEITISATLTSGWYWAVVQTDAYTSTFNLAGFSESKAPFIPGMPSNNASPGRQRAAWTISTTGSPSSLPSSWVGNQWNVAASPKVLLRRSA